jgi:hypothetical protein
MEESMLLRKNGFFFPLIFGVLLVSGIFIFLPMESVNAQCGSQASSCKNCHEVQGQDPVNNDGTGWHESHAFGDFCYICHGGNNQSTNQEEAHTGMVSPLSDVQTSCASCHPTDLMDRAGVYASALGVEIGTSGGSGSSSDPLPTTNQQSSNQEESSGSSSLPMVIDSTEIIDYNQRYAETVLGQRQINWGNVTVIALIIMIGIGGSGFVYWNERKIRGLPFFPLHSQEGITSNTPQLVQIEGYPDEIAALLPKIAKLNPIGIHALHRLLENPEDASQLLHSLSRLDPELVKQVRKLDRDSKTLLLALSGD